MMKVHVFPTQLKTASAKDILIDQVDKFHNSYFKEHLWKAATVLQKTYCLSWVVWEHAMKYGHDSTFQKSLWSSMKHWMHQLSFPIS